MQDKRFEMRIDKNLDKNVISFCNKNKITKAFLIKSILLYFLMGTTKKKFCLEMKSLKEIYYMNLNVLETTLIKSPIRLI